MGVGHGRILAIQRQETWAIGEGRGGEGFHT